MSGTPDGGARSAALAALFILIGAGLVFYFLPRVMLVLGDISPFLAASFGTLIVLGFFLVFWLRARHQRRR